MFNIVVLVIMGVAFVGMIVCAKKQNDFPAAKSAAIGLLVVVVACAIAFLLHGGSAGQNDAVQAEMKCVASSSYVLAKHLSKTMPGAKVLVVTDKIDEKNAFQQAKIKALKEALSPAITDVVFDVPPVKASPAGITISDVMVAADMDKLFAKHKDRNLIITLIGLPADMKNMKIWNQFLRDKKKTPKLAIIPGDVYSLGAFIQSGLIVGAVVSNPDYHYVDDAPVPKTYEEAFKRYLLITPQNVLNIRKKYPKMFQQ